ncbi:DeoR/GlpR family DNA-binding transcription regulator [Paenarthrobacter sp. NPDC056912]|uniref:DeoR/GlpR family DNA-binding transcription regulator n=1 Tax=Paenarthrobacter sp. NPDC056912 TaxID=3345965 RepID=UPI00366E1963
MQWREKKLIASVAVELVQPGNVVGFNGGTTTTAAAHELGIRVSAEPEFDAGLITVVTNAVNIANDLTYRPQFRVVVTGGVARPRSFELVGPLAALILPSIQIDVLFLGVDAIDLTTGAICADDEDEAAVNSALMKTSSRTVILADSSKLGRSAFGRIGTLDERTTVITDGSADPAQIALLRALGTEVLLAQD